MLSPAHSHQTSVVVITTAMLVWCLTLAHMFRWTEAITYSCSFPSYQLSILEEFYNSTNGDNWAWQEEAEAGQKWHFNDSQANPCSEHWQGLNCSNTCYITTIGLPSYNLVGTLPASLSQLNTIRNFTVSINKLTGSLPESLTNWTEIIFFDIQKNKFTGTFPSFLTQTWSKIQKFTLSYNFYYGPIPNSISQWKEVSLLNLRSNFFSGTFPTILTLMPSLRYIFLKNNQLFGTIPSAMNQLQDLILLDTSRNQLSGTIPTSITTMTKLEVFYAFSNHIHGSIPENLNNMTSLQQFSMNNNSLSGSIPWMGSLHRLLLFRVDANHLQGSIPDCFEHLTGITVFNATINHLTGSLPNSLRYMSSLQSFDVASNQLQGEINGFFTNAKDLQQLILYSNHFSGIVEDTFVNPNIQKELFAIDISDNHFQGEIPSNVFFLANLSIFAAVKNCFIGTLPEVICVANASLKLLVLDGLHTQTSCQRHIFPYIDTYLITRPVHGTLPSCLLTSMEKLELLHLSGNGLEGTLPNVEYISPTMNTLSLANNRFTGSLPVSYQTKQWLNLDLSFNKFVGVFDSNIASYAKENTSIRLENNRLSGAIYPQLRDAPNIDVLLGNMFECDTDKTQLPHEDPHFTSYECASTSTDAAIYTWLSFFCILLLFYFSEALIARFFVGKALSYLNLYHGIQSEMLKWWQVYETFHPNTKNMFEFGLSMEELRRWSIRMMMIALLIFMPTYAVLTSLFGTYTKQYAWTISIAYLSGSAPAFVMLGFLFVLLFVLYSPTNTFLLLNFFRVGKRVKKKLKLTLQFYFSQFGDEIDKLKTDIKGLDQQPSNVMKVQDSRAEDVRFGRKGIESQQQSISDEASHPTDTEDTNIRISAIDRKSIAIEPVKFTLEDAQKYYQWYAIIGCLTVFNVVIVSIANMAYVYAISNGDLNSYEKEILSFIVSVFKLIWNGSVMNNMYYYLHSKLMKIIEVESQSLLQGKTDEERRMIKSLILAETLSKRSLLISIMLWLSIFNNIIVPFIAVAFISPDCFYYMLYPSNSVDATIAYAGCVENVRQTTGGSGYYTVLNCNSETHAYSISYDPPFSYSFQCTSTLLANFIDIFMYRYILGGAVVPIAMLVFKFIQEYVLKKYGWENKWFHLLSMTIPPELRPLQNPPEEMKKELDGDVHNNEIQLEGDSMTSTSFVEEQQPSERRDESFSNHYSFSFSMLPSIFRQSTVTEKLAAAKELTEKLKNLKLQDINKMLGLSADSDMSFGLYSSIITLAVDIAVLLTFGTMFPPLAVIGCCSVYIRTFYMQFTLGRIIHLSSNQPPLKKFVMALNEECIGISKLLMSCLLSLPLLLAVLWSWFLFDIWGDRTGWNPAFAIFFCLPTIPLIFLPIIFPIVQKVLVNRFCPASHNWDEASVRGKAPKFLIDSKAVREIELQEFIPPTMMDTVQNPITAHTSSANV